MKRKPNAMRDFPAAPVSRFRLPCQRVVVAAFCAVALMAYGHDGEDHGAPPPPINQRVAPRAVAATDEFEVVAVLEGTKLIVHVDRFATNEPVVKAKVDVDGAGAKGPAGEVAPGTYAIDVAGTLAPGKYPLTVSVDAGDTADLISATLDTTDPAEGEAHSHGWNGQIIWTAAGLLLFAAAAMIAIGRSKRLFKGR